MSCAQFKLDMFEGPLDLLLHLISKHKLNIHDIQISLLLEQYLEYIHGLDHEDLEDAADFLEMAARLIYIKTVSLLPHDEEAAELKKELEGRLIEYSQCKLLAGILAGRYVGADVFVRRPEPISVDKTYTREHDAGILLDAYLGLSEKARNEKPINAKIFQPLVSHKVVSIGTKIVYILKRLYTCGVCDLSHIYDGMDSKSERVATFLAILELTKSGRIVLNDDNTQISFSERSLERKKHPKGEAAASDAEKAEQEQTAPKPDDDEEKEGGEQHQPAAAQTLQQIPEFKPDESVHMPPEPKSEQAEKPKAHIKQATERIAYNDPPVLALPMMAFVQTDTAQADEIPTEEKPEQTAQIEQTPTEDKPEQTTQAEQTPTEDKPEQTAQVEQTPTEDKPEPIAQAEETPTEEMPEQAAQVEQTPTEDKPEPIAQVVQTSAEDKPEQAAQAEEIPTEEKTEQTAQVEQTPTEDKPEPIAQVEQTPTEEKPEQTAQVEQTPTEDKPELIAQVEQTPTEDKPEPITLAQEVSETPTLLATENGHEVTLPLGSDSEEISCVPFKPNYWRTVRYYWGKSPVGDDAPRNYWRYGSARM